MEQEKLAKFQVDFEDLRKKKEKEQMTSLRRTLMYYDNIAQIMDEDELFRTIVQHNTQNSRRGTSRGTVHFSSGIPVFIMVYFDLLIAKGIALDRSDALRKIAMWCMMNVKVADMAVLSDPDLEKTQPAVFKILNAALETD